MAIINKIGITDGGIVQAEHVTRAIDALSGGSTDTIVATGSFSGSFKGDGSGLIGVGAGFPFTGSAIISGSLIVTGSTNISSSLTANDITTNNSLTVTGIADFNDAVNINTNPLTVNTATYISARTNIVELDNTTTITESVTDYPAGTTFFVAMTSSAATASFQFEPLNGNSIGTSYKILITKWSAGQIELKNTDGDTVFFGHYVSDEKPDSFASARSVKITTPEATCIEAYFINGNNKQWFFDISTAGNLTTT
jgi:hypothetical protein